MGCLNCTQCGHGHELDHDLYVRKNMCLEKINSLNEFQ